MRPRIPLFVPWRRLHIDTSLSVPEVRAALLPHVRESSLLLARDRGDGDAPFRGRVGDRAFLIQRRISHRNDFLPLIRGRLEPRGTGTRVDVLMRGSIPVLCVGLMGTFMVLVAGMVGLGLLATGKVGQGLLCVLAPLAVGSCVGAMFAAGFGSEAVIAEQRLRAILSATASAAPSTSR